MDQVEQRIDACTRRLDEHAQVLDDHGRRVVVVEAQCEAHRASMDGLRAMTEHIIANESNQTHRIEDIREILAEHERRDGLRRAADMRYRESREDAERRAHQQSLLAAWALAVSLAGLAVAIWERFL